MLKPLLSLMMTSIATGSYATAYTTPIIANTNQTVTLQPGDTVTLSAATGSGVPALDASGNNAIINAPGVKITTANATGYGASATNGAVVNLNQNTSLVTGGTMAYGIRSSGATINANNITIHTGGNSANGINAPNSPANINNTSIETTGQAAFGIMSNGITARLHGLAVQMTTFGNNSIGVNVTTRSQSTLDNSIIITKGQNAQAVQILSGASLTLSNDQLTTEGDNAFGLIATGTNPTFSTGLTGTNLIINTIGAGSHGIQIESNTTAGLTNSTITTLGMNANVLSLFNNDKTITINNSQLTTGQSTAITAQGSTATLNLQDNTLVRGGNHTLLLVTTGNTASAMTLTADNHVTLNGDVLVDTGNLLNSTIANQSLWTGTGTNVTNLTINNSQWEMTGSSTIADELTNNGIIVSNPFSPGTLQTLTTTRYYGGANSLLTLNTVLAADNAPSDQLILNGGQATGTTTLNIINLNGTGALTQHNGILLVNATNGGTTATEAFNLGNTLIAGPYQYNLFRGSLDNTGPDNWYLRSITLAPPTPPATNPAAPVIPNLPNYVPNYRPEVSLYAALPSMQLLYARMLLNTLYPTLHDNERRAENSLLTTHPSSVLPWLSISHEEGRRKNKGIFQQGPDFNYHFKTLQVGATCYQSTNPSRQMDEAGVYGMIGNGYNQVEHFTGLAAGHSSFDAYTVGGYWIHTSPSHWYIDTILQTNWYDATATGVTSRLQTDSHDMNISVTGGYPFFLRQHFLIEPQAQMIYQTLSPTDSTDGVALVRFKRTQSLASRIGLRIAQTWLLNARAEPSPSQLTAWMRGSFWHEDKGQSITQFSSANGFIPIASRLGGDWTAIDLGIHGNIAPYLTIYGIVSYAANQAGQAYYASLGIRAQA